MKTRVASLPQALATTGPASAAALVLLSSLAIAAGLWKLLGIVWVAFGAMALGAALGSRQAEARPRALSWAYGITSGAMAASTVLFLVPDAVAAGGWTAAGAGVLLGLATGIAMHRLRPHLLPGRAAVPHIALELSVHAAAAGAIMGLVYGSLPGLGPALGLAIVSHKGPAGYAAALQLARERRSAALLLLPGSAVGLAAIPAALLPLGGLPVANGLVLGFSAGVLLHVAMEFLPWRQTATGAHGLSPPTGRPRFGAGRYGLEEMASTGAGGLVILLGWLLAGA